jgi:hypothetical protein
MPDIFGGMIAIQKLVIVMLRHDAIFCGPDSYRCNLLRGIGESYSRPRF